MAATRAVNRHRWRVLGTGLNQIPLAELCLGAVWNPCLPGQGPCLPELERAAHKAHSCHLPARDVDYKGSRGAGSAGARAVTLAMVLAVGLVPIFNMLLHWNPATCHRPVKAEGKASRIGWAGTGGGCSRAPESGNRRF